MASVLPALEAIGLLEERVRSLESRVLWLEDQVSRLADLVMTMKAKEQARQPKDGETRREEASDHH